VNSAKKSQPAKAEKRRPPEAPSSKTSPKKLSALDAAAARPPGNQASDELQGPDRIDGDQGLLEFASGQDPHSTLYAAILREIGVKGKEPGSRKPSAASSPWRKTIPCFNSLHEAPSESGPLFVPRFDTASLPPPRVKCLGPGATLSLQFPIARGNFLRIAPPMRAVMPTRPIYIEGSLPCA